MSDVQTVLDGGPAFVSYSRADLSYVRRLVECAESRGAATWYDERIPTGELWESELRHRIAECATFVLVMSPEAQASEWVRIEVELARSLGKPIMPLLLAGDILFGLDDVQHESVRGRRMPSDAFIARLPRRPVPAGAPLQSPRLTHMVGLVPNEADCFQERDLLRRLEEALTERGTAVVTQMLTGLGGVGKTQLAAALARLHLDCPGVDAMVWVSARSRDDIVTSFARAGRKVCGADDTVPERAAETFLQWLQTTSQRWLVVLDDVADPADLTGLWPPRSPAGRVVVTTRRRDAALASHGRLVQVGLFTPDEARAYLTEKFAGNAGRLEGAGELAEDVGFLPLMLAQAAAFIVDQDITCAEYAIRLRHARTLVDVLPERSGRPDDYLRDVAAAVLLSLDAADTMEPVGLSRPLLSMLSLLDPNGVPEQLVTTPPVLEFLTEYGGRPTDADQALAALGCLARFNLVDRALDPAGGTVLLRVHALVQRATRDHAAPQPLAAAASAAAEGMTQTWPEVERDVALGQALRASTAILREHAADRLWAPSLHPVLIRAGRSLGESGLVGAAAQYFRQLADEAATRLGPDHPDTLQCRADMVRWHGESGDPPGAAAAAEALLADRTRVLGADHTDTLTTRGSLARWRGESGDWPGALAILEDLLRDRLRLLGAAHFDTLGTQHELARWRGLSGDPAGALEAYRALLVDVIPVLGADHPNTLTTRNNVAAFTGLAGDPDGAVVAYAELLTDRLRILGPDHPHTHTTRYNLAQWRGKAGDPAAAAAGFQELLADQLRVLGPEHPETLATRGSLAQWQAEAGDPAGAAAALSDLLIDHLRLLGPGHLETIATRNRLAVAQGMAGDLATAVAGLETVLADRDRLLGPGHPDTRATREYLERWRAQLDGAER
ncbi:FxSxx-COOH system tetratricopeptide repeat protein [Dactylosporangium sp. NPDC049525]|uniref:FxSxx-COOH system tetratricopeptide repeat protein n=1 Tax=Dactylosporangium sp. NPDC049525 TaxID=3154730 RepID=UPI00342D2703